MNFVLLRANAKPQQVPFIASPNIWGPKAASPSTILGHPSHNGLRNVPWYSSYA